MKYKSADLNYDVQRGFLLVANAGRHLRTTADTSLDSLLSSVAGTSTITTAVITRAYKAAVAKKLPPLPPLGTIPKNRRDIDLMPEPYRSHWEHAYYAEQVGQLMTGSFDLIPARIARNAMSHKPLKNVMVYKEKTDPNIDGIPHTLVIQEPSMSSNHHILF